jgi:medium-chain acyl-[acyl-carrier-protein] hydrolase
MIANTSNDVWVVPGQAAKETRLRLFCFANAGGSPAQFRSWQHDLPAGVEVCPVQLPGQGSRFRETPYTRVEPLIDDLADVLEPYYDEPFAFWGYSMGALVSFELARAIQRRGVTQLRHLFVAARRAPHLPPSDSPVHTLPEPALIEAIQQRYNGIPTAVLQEPEMLALFIPVLRANFELLETYNFTDAPPLSCPITAFGGLNDPTVDVNGITAWASLTEGAFQQFMFPGDHFFVQKHQPALLHIAARKLLSHLA